MEKWVLMRKGAPFQEIADKFHIHPVIARIIRNRNIVGDAAIDDYLNGTITDLHDGMLLKDMDKAVDILLEKIHNGDKIRIIGDYDIDGINATYILLEGIRKLGGNVDIDIPDRMKDGYGLNHTLIERADSEDVDTIVTCDNGIAASEEIQYAQSIGMTVIVTDHHEVPYVETKKGKQQILPPANAVIDPKREDCVYPFRELCGAAVAYKLVEALFEVSGHDIEDVDYLMENVAIATVGDVMPLIGENRIFVKQGLDMLKRTRNAGLEALMASNQILQTEVTAYHIGFVLGPCLNATGRLDTAKKALALLCASTWEEATMLAHELTTMNEYRKELTVQAVEAAVRQVEYSARKQDKILVLYLPDCHESLAGIVAGRIRERYYKPTLIVTRAEDGLKGSARSIETYDMFKGLSECKTLLTRFGGHKMAAGFSLEERNLESLRMMLNSNSALTEEDLIPKVSIDMQLPFGLITEEMVTQLELLEPFGKDNTKPIFAEKDVEILQGRVMGTKQNVLRMSLRDSSGVQMNAVYFGEVQKFLAFLEKKYSPDLVGRMLQGQQTGMKAAFTYYPSIHEYMGNRNLQITIQHYQ